MNNTLWNVWIIVFLAALTVTAMASVRAGEPAYPEEHNSTGTLKSIDLKERTLFLGRFLLRKRFNLGAACSLILPDHSAGTLEDLQPGDQVTVSYQAASGVLVADRIELLARTTGTDEPNKNASAKRDCRVLSDYL
jgi:hypothetical protein